MPSHNFSFFPSLAVRNQDFRFGFLASVLYIGSALSEPFFVGRALAQCHLVFSQYFGIGEVASNVSIKEGALGSSTEQVAKQLRRDPGIGVASAIAKIQLQLTATVVINHGGQSRGVETHPTGRRRSHRRTSLLGERRKGECPPRPQTSRGSELLPERSGHLV